MPEQETTLDLNEDLLRQIREDGPYAAADRTRASAWRVFVAQMIGFVLGLSFWFVVLRALSKRWARQVVAETRSGPQ